MWPWFDAIAARDAAYIARVRDFKGLKAWAKAHALLLNVHRALRRFPRKYSSLSTQIRRATESVPGNIVEGCGRLSQREFASYLQHSISSSNEVEYWLLVARDYGALSQREWSTLTNDTIEVRKIVTGLIKKLREGT